MARANQLELGVSESPILEPETEAAGLRSVAAGGDLPIDERCSETAQPEPLRAAAKRYLLGIEAFAVVLAAGAVWLSAPPTIGGVLLAVSLAGGMGLIGLTPLTIGRRGKLYLDTAALVAAVLLFSPFLAIAVGAVGRSIALRFQRQVREETRFNTAMVVIQAGVGGALLWAVDWSPTRLLDGGGGLLLGLGAGAVVWLVNPLLVIPMMSFQGTISLGDAARALIASVGRAELLLDFSQVGIGVLVAEVAVAYRWQVALLLLPAGALYQALAYHISLRRRAEQRFRHQAFHDALTDLPNRAAFLDRPNQALGASGRGRGRLGLLFVDLDRFKFVNDSLGHVFGDELLVQVSQTLRDVSPAGSMVSRFGGDEFTILLPDQTNPATAERIADRIAGSLEMPYRVEGHVAAVTASIGIAFANPGHRSAADLLRDADVALYRAKRNGKARYAVFDANVDQDALQKVALEVELRRAVAEQEFFLVFQPQIALATGQPAGVEALLRWRHPTRGVLSPNAFIPLAEESDMILPIGRWVLTEACCRGQEWRQRHDTATTISVNLSARQFQDPALVDDVAAALASSGLDPSGLKLELTESTMITEASDADILARLKALGVQIAIDDFGTGYSSLDYLRRFPIDELKIDRAFVAGLGRDGGDTTIVRAVVGLAHALGLVVVAEGVETSAQLRRLRELGCELGQGFFLSRPLPATDIGSLLTRRSGQPTSREPVVLFAPAPRSEVIGP